MNKSYIKMFLTLIIIAFIYFYKVNISSNSIDKFYLKYQPNYDDLLKEKNYVYAKLNEYYEFIPAQVLHPSTKSINSLFLINKGSKSNIKNGSFVVNDDGLVGVIIKVFNNFSVVRIITSNQINLAVEVNDCYGTLVKSNKKYIINDLINCSNITKNDSVFTSKYSYSGSNILVGHVESIKDSSIYVEPVINPYKIRYVGVINDNN